MQEIQGEVQINEFSEGSVEFVIDGLLDCIILNPTGLCEVTLKSELGYTIFNSKEINEICYIPIRVHTLNKKGHLINFVADKYNLKEKIILQVNFFSKYKNFKFSDSLQYIIRYDGRQTNN